MTHFHHSLRNWNTAAFQQTLKTDIANVPAGTLPLDKAVAQGGFVDDSRIETTILAVTEDTRHIFARVGIFFTEIVACCGCGDEPQHTHAYCVMQINIDKATAEVQFAVVQE